MANQEIVKILRVETNNSERTVKQLKEEITMLRDALLNVEKGSEDYNAILSQLRQNQSDLTQAMTAGKEGVEALEGSYNYLNETLKNLRKEWKTTTDAVRRNELGQEIDKINSELKEMDASIGNYQRNVGNYANDITKALNNQNTATENTVKKLASVQKMASGLANGYAAIQGATALLGVENEDLQKTFVKLQGAIALAQGVGGMKDLIEGANDARKAFVGASAGVKIFNVSLASMKGALISTGIGALIVLLGVLIAKIAEWVSAEKEVKKNADSLIASHSKMLELLKDYKLFYQTTDALDKYTKKIIEAKGNIDLLTQAQREYNEELKKTNLQSKEEELNLLKKQRTELVGESVKYISQFGFDERQAIMLDDDVWGALPKKRQKKYGDTREKYREEYLKFNKGIDDIDKKIIQVESDINAITLELNNKIVETAIENNNQRIDNALSVLSNKNKELEKVASNIQSIKDETKNALSEKEYWDYEDLRKQWGEEYKGILAHYDNLLNAQKNNTQETLRLEEEKQIQLKQLQKRYEIKIADLERSAEIQSVNAEWREKKEIIEKSQATLNSLLQNWESEKTKILEKGERERKNIEGDFNAQIAVAKNEEQKTALINALNERLQVLQETQNLELADRQKYYDDLKKQVGINEEEILKVNAFYTKKYNDVWNNYFEEREAKEEEIANNELIMLQNNLKSIDTLYNNAKDKVVEQYADTSRTTEIESVRNEIMMIESLMDVETQQFNKKIELIDAELAKEKIATKTRLQLLREKAEAEEEFTNTYKQLSQKRQDLDNKETHIKRENARQIFMASLDASVAFSNALVALTEAEMSKYEEGSEEHKKVWEVNKKMQIGATIIETLAGATRAFTSAMQLGPIAGPIVGGVLAASTLAMGYANVEKIRQTTYEGGGTTNETTNIGAIATPSLPTASMLPIEYTRNVQTNSEISEINKAQKVYVLESDITEAQRKVKVTEDNSTF